MSSNHNTIGAPSERDDLLCSPGRRFDEFELVECLGRGNMGEVWKARDHAGNRDVALKFVPRDLQRFNEEINRVRETFEKIHALQDRHICPVYAMRQHPQYGVYLVMKYVDGVTLATYRKRFKHFSTAQAVEVLTPVAEALDSAHEQGVIHRDIKPTNILVQTDPQNRDVVVDVQLVDFGLAAEIRKSMTRASQVEVSNSGTRPYMAPEQWRGQQQDGATDQYALAVVAYELLAGHLPFDSDDTAILRECVLREIPQKIDGVEDTVNDTLQCGLAKERKNRFSSCKILIQMLINPLLEQATPPRANQGQPEEPLRPMARKLRKELRHLRQQDKVFFPFLAILCFVIYFICQERNFIVGPTWLTIVTVAIIVVNIILVILFLRKTRPENVQTAENTDTCQFDNSEPGISDNGQTQKKNHFFISDFIVKVLAIAIGICFVLGLFHNKPQNLRLIPFFVTVAVIIMILQRRKNMPLKTKTTKNSDRESNISRHADSYHHTVNDLQSKKLNWENLLLAIPCVSICIGINAVGFAAMGAGIGILLEMPAVFTPLGAGLGIIIGAVVGWSIAAKTRFR